MKSLTFGKFPVLDYACTEAINTLCTNITFTGNNYKRILITSVGSSEGKSFLAMEMMRTLAEFGKIVVFIDTDLRRSMVEARYRIRYAETQHYGITHFLAGKCEIEDVFYSTDLKRAFFVPVGYAVSNSLALLNSTRFPNLMDQLASQVDYILVDAPPVGMIVDALEVAKSCDGALLTVGYNTVRRRELLDARTQIERSGCPVLGAVINNVPPNIYSSRKGFGGYYSRYAKEYYQKQE